LPGDVPMAATPVIKGASAYAAATVVTSLILETVVLVLAWRALQEPSAAISVRLGLLAEPPALPPVATR